MEFYVLDTETTGLTAGFHEIIEISIIRVSNKMQLTKSIKSIYPERVNPEALKINGKTLSDLRTGLFPKEAVDLCNKFFMEDGLSPSKRCIIAHNAPFDQRHCYALWKQQESILPVDFWVDSMALMRHYNKQTGVKAKVNLVASLETMGIVKVAGGSHNAKSDTRDTFNLWNRLTKVIGPKYLEFITHAPMVSSTD